MLTVVHPLRRVSRPRPEEKKEKFDLDSFGMTRLGRKSKMIVKTFKGPSFQLRALSEHGTHR